MRELAECRNLLCFPLWERRPSLVRALQSPEEEGVRRQDDISLSAPCAAAAVGRLGSLSIRPDRGIAVET